EDLRQANIEAQIRRARNDPPPTEIWSAKSLNDVLTGIQRTETGTGLQGPAVPLDQELLRHIHFTDGTTVGSPSNLKARQPLEWPNGLTGDRFSAERMKVDQLMNEAVKQLTVQGRVDSGTINGLRDNLNAMKAKVKGAVDDLSADDYMEANRYLNQMSDTVR